MDFIELAKSRYSCKKFDSRQISKEQLDSILEAGRLAPTAKNLQEQYVYVVQSAEGLAKVDALTPCRYGAPKRVSRFFRCVIPLGFKPKTFRTGI